MKSYSNKDLNVFKLRNLKTKNHNTFMRLTLYTIIIRMHNFHGNTEPKKDRQERKKLYMAKDLI